MKFRRTKFVKFACTEAEAQRLAALRGELFKLTEDETALIAASQYLVCAVFSLLRSPVGNDEETFMVNARETYRAIKTDLNRNPGEVG